MLVSVNHFKVVENKHTLSDIGDDHTTIRSYVADRTLTHILRVGGNIKSARIFEFVNGGHIHTEGKWTGPSVKGPTKVSVMAYNLQAGRDEIFSLFHKGLHTF
jgi:hypothetical protein